MAAAARMGLRKSEDQRRALVLDGGDDVVEADSVLIPARTETAPSMIVLQRSREMSGIDREVVVRSAPPRSPSAWDR